MRKRRSGKDRQGAFFLTQSSSRALVTIGRGTHFPKLYAEERNQLMKIYNRLRKVTKNMLKIFNILDP